MKEHTACMYPRTRLKNVVSLRQSAAHGDDDRGRFVGLENIEPWTGRLVGASDRTDGVSDAADKSFGNAFECGDVLFGKLRPYLAKAWLADFKGYATTELLVLRPTGVESRFLRYICLSRNFVDAVDSRTFGSRMPRTDWSTIQSMSIPVPADRLQSEISNRLDREMGRLDALVAEKKRMAALLEEKRRTFVTRILTRGTNHRASLRHSGIPWLGEIPTHWPVVQLKFVSTSMQTGPFGSQLHARDYVSDGIPLVNPSNLSDGRIEAIVGFSVDEITASRLETHRLRLGDIVFARRGKMGMCGVVERRNVDWLCGTGSLRVRLHKELAVPAYIAALFSETRIAGFLANVSIGSTMDNLNTEILGRCQVPVPPIDEQHAIVEHITDGTANLRAAHLATNRSIALVEERRAAVIDAAVTGALDFGHST